MESNNPGVRLYQYDLLDYSLLVSKDFKTLNNSIIKNYREMSAFVVLWLLVGRWCLLLFFFLGKGKEIWKRTWSVFLYVQDSPVLPVLHGMFLRRRIKDSQKFSGQNPKTVCRDLCNSEEGSPKSWACLHTNVVCWFWCELSDAVHEKLLKGVEEQMKKSSFNCVMSFVITHLAI